MAPGTRIIGGDLCGVEEQVPLGNVPWLVMILTLTVHVAAGRWEELCWGSANWSKADSLVPSFLSETLKNNIQEVEKSKND